MKKVIAMYPGSFDPPTNGHLDLIARGSKIFDELVVAILRNAEKAPLFNLSERLLMLEAMTAGFRNVRVETFDGLMVDYAAKVKASAVLRGIRAISDYEYELQMALMNRKLQPDLETVFMMPAEQYSYLSSRLVREIAQLGGSVKDLVPELVEQRLKEKLDPAVKLANARKLKPGNQDDSSYRNTSRVKLTERINRIQPSATMAVVAEADKLRQQGIDVVDFGAGEPHFATPQHIKDAAIAAIHGNFTKYTAVAGTAEYATPLCIAMPWISIRITGGRVIASTGGSKPCLTRCKSWPPWG